MSSFNMFFIFSKIIFVLLTSTAFAKNLDKIVAAKVNEYVISAQDVLDAVNKLPQKLKNKPLPELYPKVVNELINQYLVTKKAYDEKLHLNESIIVLLKKNQDKVIAKFWLNSFLENKITDDVIKSYYKNYLKNFKKYKEVNASHILVNNKKEATLIIKKLKNNSKFSELAKLHSIGPSGKNEGNLGWFGPGQMVSEFEKATFALKKGGVTDEPIKTRFGYHIIKLNNTRLAQPKELSEIRENIIEKIKKVSLQNLENEIRSNQKITIVKFNDIVKEVNN